MPKSDSTSDTELVEGLRSADRAISEVAFEEVVGRYQGLVMAIAVGVTGDTSGAQDVSQNSFLKVFRNIETLTDPTKLKSWIGHIARTTSIDWMRRRKHLKVSLDDLQEQGAHVPETETAGFEDPAEQIASTEAHGRMLEAIASLPAKYREVLTLKHLSELSYQEISETLDISVSAVESRLYRARGMLRDRIERMGLLEPAEVPPPRGSSRKT